MIRYIRYLLVVPVEMGADRLHSIVIFCANILVYFYAQRIDEPFDNALNIILAKAFTPTLIDRIHTFCNNLESNHMVPAHLPKFFQ